MTLTSSRHVRRVLVLAALSVALTPVAAEASVKNGAKCSKVGQMSTIKKKKKSTKPVVNSRVSSFSDFMQRK